MLNKLLISTAIVCAGATAGLAQGFTGAELGIEYTDFPDVDDLSSVTYFGSAEFEVVPNVAVAADISFYDFEVGDADVSNFTVHGIYALNDATKIGAFFGRDDVEDLTIDNYGIEGVYDFGFGAVEGYLGFGDDGADDITYFGVAGNYGLGGGFGVVGALDVVSIDEIDVSTIEVGGEYALAAGPKFSATFGSLTIDDDFGEESENYFKIAASIGLGPQGGTTFSRKGLFEVLPASAN